MTDDRESGRGRIMQKWGWRERVRRGETVNLIIVRFATVYVCVCVDALHTSAVLAYRPMVLSCASACICVCVFVQSDSCARGPWFTTVTVGTNRSSAGTRVKEMSAMDSQHQLERVFIPVFFKKGSPLASINQQQQLFEFLKWLKWKGYAYFLLTVRNTNLDMFIKSLILVGIFHIRHDQK